MSEWSMSELGTIVDIQTGKLDSNQADPTGSYPFFTCAPEPLKINHFSFDCDAILLAGNNANGVFHLNRYCGKFNAYQRTYVITPKDPESIHIQFLFYLLHTLTRRLGEYSQGTATKFLTMKILSSLPIPLPPLPEQRVIAHILGTLDDKIELNRRMNETLEAMARAIFKSWFVDFDPVRAKAEGRDTGLPNEIDDLFPDSFEETELGEVPEGWRISKLSNVCEYIMSGGTPSTQIPAYWDGDIPWLSSGETRNRFITKTEKTITNLGVEKSSTRLARAKSTVIAGAGQGHTRGQTSLLLFDSYINQSVVALAADSKQVSDYYLFFNLSGRYEELRQISDSHSSRGSLTTRLVNNLHIVVPSLRLISKFDQFTETIIKQIHQNLLESKNLVEIRDTLLPKLLSGELRIDIKNKGEEYV